MKKIIIFLFVFALNSNVFAQITITYEDFAKPGENFIMAIANFKHSDKIKIENFKKGNTWDFSKLPRDSYDTIRNKLPENTQYGELFDSCTIAKHYRWSKVLYWHLSSDGLTKIGAIDDYLHIGTPAYVYFSTPITKYRFPFTLGSVYGDTVAFRFKSPFDVTNIDSIKCFVNIQESTEFDDYGKIKTVMGTYTTIREKNIINKDVRTNKYTFLTWEPAPKLSKKVTLTTYRWYAKNQGIPVVEATLFEDGYVSQIKYKFSEPMKLDFKKYNPACKGGKNGAIKLILKGGIPDYTYNWSNGSNKKNPNKLTKGTYSVEVTDNKNKTINGKCTLTEPKDSLILTVNPQDISCFGEKDGKIFANVTGGVPPYFIVWSTNEKKDSIINLDEGIYGIITQDANRCVKTDSVVISAPKAPLRIFIETNKVTCFAGSDGSIYPTVEGGTKPYTYLWSTGDTTSVLDSIPAGEYFVEVTDAHACVLQKKALLDEPINPLKIEFDITSVNCYGGDDGNVKTIVTGGEGSYKYKWSNSEIKPTIYNLTADKYVLKITDRLGCVLIDTATVLQPKDSIIINYSKTDVSCFSEQDGSISLEVTGGTPQYTYNWRTGQSSAKINNLRAYEYIVTVKDNNYCTATKIIKITQARIQLTIYANPQHVKCFEGNDGAIYASIVGGTAPYIYEWNDGTKDTSLTNLEPGMYTFSVSDKNNCKAIKKIEIKEPATLLQVEPKVTNVSCNGLDDGVITLNVTGGVEEYYFKWSTGEEIQTMTNLKPGLYSVTTTDSYGCKVLSNITIREPDILQITSTVTNTSNGKDNGKIELVIEGGTKPYTIEWADGNKNNIRANLSKKNYVVTVSDANNCIMKNKIIEVK